MASSSKVATASAFYNAYVDMYGTTEVLVRDKLNAVLAANPDLKWPHLYTDKQNRIGRGTYRFFDPENRVPSVQAPMPTAVATVSAPENVVAMPKVTQSNFNVDTEAFVEGVIPDVDPLFTEFGEYDTVKTVVSSGQFFPVFLTGLSGNGKTTMIQQVCAKLKRACIRVNFTEETDEDDLIGGFRLVDGDTKFFKGPVIHAMQQGAVLILDELDLGTPSKIMCLQSIMEGSGYYIKKTGEFVRPAPGFNIIATANTKGRGNDRGQFVGVNVLNEAFLERFIMTLEQPYPPVATEKKLLRTLFNGLNMNPDEDFIRCLAQWADAVRESYYNEAIEDVISTRRLCHIVKTYAIFGDRLQAVNFCLNRFDEETREEFMQLYTKVDAEVSVPSEEEQKEADADTESNLPF